MAEPDREDDFTRVINPDSLSIIDNARLEPSLSLAPHGQQFQFERQGYFVQDTHSSKNAPVFNLIVGLRDSWAREKQA